MLAVAGLVALTAGGHAGRFDAARAWSLLRYQVQLGPRPTGSPQSRRLAEFIRARLPHGRFEDEPGGFRNVVGSLPGRGKAILVGAHYDTKVEPFRFVGANDGAGGTAELLELARALRHSHRPAGAPGGRCIPRSARARPSTAAVPPAPSLAPTNPGRSFVS